MPGDGDKTLALALALDRCTEQAFCTALGVLKPRGRREVLPIVPLVLGGDDLTESPPTCLN